MSFWPNRYKVKVTITSFKKMLELANLDHMTKPAI